MKHSAVLRVRKMNPNNDHIAGAMESRCKQTERIRPDSEHQRTVKRLPDDKPIYLQTSDRWDELHSSCPNLDESNELRDVPRKSVSFAMDSHGRPLCTIHPIPSNSSNFELWWSEIELSPKPQARPKFRDRSEAEHGENPNEAHAKATDFSSLRVPSLLGNEEMDQVGNEQRASPKKASGKIVGPSWRRIAANSA